MINDATAAANATIPIAVIELLVVSAMRQLMIAV